MPLPSATRLGPYEILSAIGAGGMGEVYRARETRLERAVAIKVLPEHLSSKLMVVELKAGKLLQTAVPQVLFQTPTLVSPINTQYCVMADGKRFIFREPVGEANAPITVVLNWAAGLKH
jgi:serine/threonine protein kinase